MLTVTPIPTFTDNYVWMIHHPTQDEVCVVDPGEAEPVIHALRERNLRLNSIFITHSHFDHIGGIDALVRHQPAPVIGPSCTGIPRVRKAVAEGDTFTLWDAQVTVWHLPGHLPEHVAYVITHGGSTQVFSGDVLFAAGCGRIFNGTHEQLKNSLDRYQALPDDTLVYAAHEYTANNLLFAQAVEPDNNDIRKRAAKVDQIRQENQPTLPTRLGDERKTNPFLRCGQATVQAMAGEQLGREPIDELEVFSTIRKWKDQF